jgi:hypothetical protein
LRWLLAEAKRRYRFAVAVKADPLEVVEEATSLGNKLQKATTGVVVFCVGFEVLGQVNDAFGEKRNLYFRRAGVALVGAKLGDEFRLLCR